MNIQIDWWNLINTIIALVLGLWAAITTYRFNHFKKETDRLNEMPYFKVEGTSIPSGSQGNYSNNWDVTLKNLGGDCFSFDLECKVDFINTLTIINKNVGIIAKNDLITIRISPMLHRIIGEKKENILFFDINLKDKRSITYVQNCSVTNIGQIEVNRKIVVNRPILKR